MYKDILTLIKSIYDFGQASYFWFKEFIKTMTLKALFKPFKTEPFILCRLNELETVIVIVYVDYRLSVGDKPALVNTIE